MTIESAYEKLKLVIGADRIEPLRAAVEVERLRQAWRPNNVRIVLLAESHVWTSHSEFECRVRLSDQHETGFVRFVYCLGYGEASLIVGRAAPEKNSGTWQYWRLFNDCVHGPRDRNLIKVLKRTTPNAVRRLEAKIELLSMMRERGLWLVDASVTALYRQGQKLAAGNKYLDALCISWEEHVGNILRECRPEKVLVVGKAVEQVLRNPIQDMVPSVEICCITQPNARLKYNQIQSMRSTCGDFCSGLGAPERFGAE